VCAARKGTTSQRGYGTPHQRLRKQVAEQVAAGIARCWRCSELIEPGQAWDLGHDPADPRIYKGPEHENENRNTRGRQ
jgi:hypothetical protein